MNKNKNLLKKAIYVCLLLLIILPSCSSRNGNANQFGNQKQSGSRAPFGMTYVPQGAYMRGIGGEDPAYTQTYSGKTVSIGAFYMDEAEITNSQYKQFVNWVLDSIKRRLLAENWPDQYLLGSDEEEGERPLNWRTKIKYTPEVIEALEPIYVQQEDRYFQRKEINILKLNYEYYWFDYIAAAQKNYNQPSSNDGIHMGAFASRSQSLQNRSSFIKKEIINVYPDTLCWILDFAYSYNEPMVRSYFQSPMFAYYPVIGVNWKQAKAYCEWRSQTTNAGNGEKFRLPTEAEWEYAARGGIDLSPYPWGGPYAMNDKGCLLGNFKPQKGRYGMDGSLYPNIVGHYSPNDYGLYDMMGNVAEWCIDAYDETYEGMHDFNPSYEYNAKDSDPVAMKRKVIKGGSFKDFAEFTKVYARRYEYQDTCKSYIGFRCVMNVLGFDSKDKSNNGSHLYK